MMARPSFFLGERIGPFPGNGVGQYSKVTAYPLKQLKAVLFDSESVAQGVAMPYRDQSDFDSC
jgi:hypothetical protein